MPWEVRADASPAHFRSTCRSHGLRTPWYPDWHRIRPSVIFSSVHPVAAIVTRMRYWLIKSEPTTYGIDRMARDKTTAWNGVRNFQARNFMRDHMNVGDRAFFYHSNCEEPGIVGIVEVSGPALPDDTQFDKKSHY